MQSSFIMHGARPQAGARPLSTGSARQLLAPPCGQRGYHRSAAISPTRASANRQRLHVSAASAEKMTVRQVIETLMARTDLSEQQAEDALRALLSSADSAQIAAFLVLLRAKGETPAEIAGLARAMRASGLHVDAGPGVLDIVGTGGDNVGTVNISTGACLLAAAAGARVAKHGNRSVSSLCGSGDVVEKLGVAIELGPEGVAACIKEVGVGFMFAPRFHPAMKHVAPVRKSLGVRTAFNILGPMLNPAKATHALVGVYTPELLGLMAESLQRLGLHRALVVNSMGIDELTPCAPAEVVEVTQNSMKRYTLHPSELGLKSCTIEDLKGGDATVNAQILRDVFGGQQGPVADALCLNAGVALAAAGVASTPHEGVAMAQEVQRAGKPGVVLEKWIKRSQELLQQERSA